MKKRLISIMLIMGVLLSLSALAVSAQGSGTQANGKPFLGITFGPNDNGAVVTSVLGGTPAAAAGLESGDIITSLNGENVTAANLAAAVSQLSVGATVKLDVLRNGKSMEIDATLGTQSQAQAPFPQLNPSPVGRAYLGVTLNQTNTGIVIASVVNGSPAADAGLQAGDVLTAINGTAVQTSAAAAAMIRTMNPGDTVTLSITRDGASQDVQVTLGSRAPQAGTLPPMMRGDVVMFDGQNWRVIALSQNSPLAGAGLQTGDVVTAFNGESLDPTGLSNLLNSQSTNANVTLTVERNGATQSIDVPANALSAFTMFGGEFGEGGESPFPFGFTPRGVTLGVQFTTLNATIAAQHNLSVTDGALITQVVPNSPADQAGLKVGDVIVSVDSNAVDAQHTLRDRVSAYQPGDQITLGVVRDGNNMTVDVTLDNGTGMGNMPFGFGEGGEPRPFGPGGQFNMPQPATPQAEAPNPNA